MNTKGRKRKTDADFTKDVANYCQRWAVSPCQFPSYPTGVHSSIQHKHWHKLYKMRDRLKRRAAGICERCPSPVDSATSIQCSDHRALNSARAGQHGATYQDRVKLHALQLGCCLICSKPVSLWDDIDHCHRNGGIRGLLHHYCNLGTAYLEKLIGVHGLEAAIHYIRQDKPLLRKSRPRSPRRAQLVAEAKPPRSEPQ